MVKSIDHKFIWVELEYEADLLRLLESRGLKYVRVAQLIKRTQYRVELETPEERQEILEELKLDNRGGKKT